MDHEHKIQTEGLSILQKEQQEILKKYQRNMEDFVCDVLSEIVPPRISQNKAI